MSAEEKLPVHGFVLAGGKSSRMGTDKALLEFCGRPLVQIAVEKLRAFCETVSIVGDRADLALFAPVVTGERVDCGPAAGIEAGLRAARRDWCLFVPVDVPLVPGELLRRWAGAVLEKSQDGCSVSFLLALGERQPAFCMVRREGLGAIAEALGRGHRALADLLYSVEDDRLGWMWACDALQWAPGQGASESEMDFWFQNLNTPQQLDEAEVWVRHLTDKSQ